jgi:hypothetical protein
MGRMSTGREDRIERLKQQIRKVTGEEPFFSSIPACPPEIEEAFLERVLGFEQASRQPLRERLSDAGIFLTDPDELADNDLTQQMWDVIQALVTLHIIPINTDHLSDRQVYSYLWHIVRNGETVMPDFFSRGWYIDFTGQGERGLDVYVKYYASDDERRDYQSRFPHHPIPDHCEPPYDRDHLIPDL